MKYKCFTILAIISLFSLTSFGQLQPPAAIKKAKVYQEHGNQRVDDYHWMNTPDSATVAYLNAENDYLQSYLKPTEDLQKKLYEEIVSRIEQKDESLPTKSNGYWYYNRFEEGAQYPKYFRRKGSMTAPEEILLDLPAMAKGYQIYLLRGSRVSPDNKLVAYLIDTTGGRRSTLFIKNLETGELLKDVIYPVTGSLAWGNDNKTLYYNIPDKTVRSYKVMKHTLGTDPTKDEEVYTENDNTFTVYVSPSLDNKYIFIFSNSTEATEARYIDASNTTKDPVLVQPRSRGLLYYPAYYGGDVFYIRTNKDAKNFKLVSAPISNPGIENWKDIVPHKKDEYFQGYYVLQNFLVTQTKKNGLNQISYTDRRTNKSFNLAFGEDAYVASMYLPTDELSSDSIRYYYSSLTTPASEFGYNLSSQKRTLLKKQQVGGGYTSGLYETKRIWTKATDSTMIPSTIVYRRDRMKKDGSNPMLLYAYGSYGANSEPYFNSSIISLLDRGFIYGIAHIRGGQELGREWYESGRQLKKKNTFTDFIDVAQNLVNEKYTSANRLFANGVSAGGMLMGAITNMRPDLFKGIIAEVPWMDVISDSFDPTIPLVSLEWDEWGNPNNKDVYDYMLTWSPLENVKKANYPAILATGGLHDTQVPYYSPAKWVAKVREHNMGNHPVLLKTNMGAGHGGESGRFERQKLTALKFAFALNLLGWSEDSQTYSLPKQF